MKLEVFWLDRNVNESIKCAALRGGKKQNDVMIELIEAGLESMNLKKYPLEAESKEILYTRLMEECSEVAIEANIIAKFCSKSKRFGFKESDYKEIIDALEGLEMEMKDVKLIAKEIKRRKKLNE